MKKNNRKQSANNHKLEKDLSVIEKIWQSIKSLKVSVKNISIFTVATFVVGAIPAYYAIVDHQEKEIEKVVSIV